VFAPGEPSAAHHHYLAFYGLTRNPDRALRECTLVFDRHHSQKNGYFAARAIFNFLKAQRFSTFMPDSQSSPSARPSAS
jgi:hypothetical protein